MVKEFVANYKHKKEIFDLQNDLVDNSLESNKNSLFNNYIIDILLFITALISLMFTVIVVSIGCKHAILKSLITSIALQEWIQHQKRIYTRIFTVYVK